VEISFLKAAMLEAITVSVSALKANLQNLKAVCDKDRTDGSQEYGSCVGNFYRY
jgi:uncharacterized protein YecT (DUF1311 family)